MNWGLFLALAGFVLPLTLVIRFALTIAASGKPIRRPLQIFRLLVVLLLIPPILSKVPAMMFALTGNANNLAATMIAFMVTPWGVAHLVIIVIAIGAIDVFTPRIEEQLRITPASGVAHGARYLMRDAAIVGVLLMLAWAGSR